MQYFYDSYNIVLFSSCIIGVGYCFFFIQGKFSERIGKQPYNQLRDTNYFLKQFLLTLGIGLIGYYIGAFFLLMPFSFLVAFWLLNYLTELRTGKPIIFGTRWNAPKKKRWISGLNTFLVLMLTFTLTFALALLFGLAKLSNGSILME